MLSEAVLVLVIVIDAGPIIPPRQSRYVARRESPFDWRSCAAPMVAGGPGEGNGAQGRQGAKKCGGRDRGPDGKPSHRQPTLGPMCSPPHASLDFAPLRLCASIPTRTRFSRKVGRGGCGSHGSIRRELRFAQRGSRRSTDTSRLFRQKTRPAMTLPFDHKHRHEFLIAPLLVVAERLA